MITLSNLQANNILNCSVAFINEIEASSIVRIKFRKLFVNIAQELQIIEKEVDTLKGDFKNIKDEDIIKLLNEGNKEFISILSKINELYNLNHEYDFDVDKDTIESLANQVTKSDLSLLFEALL